MKVLSALRSCGSYCARVANRFVLLFAAYAAVGQSPPGRPVEQERQASVVLAEQLENVQRHWGADMCSPGASLQLNEITRKDGTTTYRLHAEGMPQDGTYSVVLFPIGQAQPSPFATGASVGSSGRVASADGKEVRISVSPARGEPFRVALISEDDKVRRAVAQTVPIPIRASDRGCSIEAVLLMPDGSAVELSGRGFAAGAEITFESSSRGESHVELARADSSGNYVAVVLPFVQGFQGGVTRAKMTTKECGPGLDFEWGSPPKP